VITDAVMSRTSVGGRFDAPSPSMKIETLFSRASVMSGSSSAEILNRRRKLSVSVHRVKPAPRSSATAFASARRSLGVPWRVAMSIPFGAKTWYPLFDLLDRAALRSDSAENLPEPF
jgi:hypothetical protein